MRFVNAVIVTAGFVLGAVTVAAGPASADGAWREAALRDGHALKTDDDAAWPLLSRLAQADTSTTDQPAATTEAPADDSRPEKYSGVWWAIQEWLARANREFQGVVVKGLSTPAPTELAQPKSGDDPIAAKIRETETPPARDETAEVAPPTDVASPAPSQAAPAAPAETAERASPQPSQADAARARREADRQRQAAAADARAEAEKARAEQQRRQAAEERRKAIERQRAEEQRALAEAAELRRRAEERRRAEAARANAEREAGAAREAARETNAREERVAAAPKVNRRQFELTAEPLSDRPRRSTQRRAEPDVVIETEEMIVERPDPVSRPRAVSRPYPVRTYSPRSRRRAIASWRRVERRRMRRTRHHRATQHRRRRAACRRNSRHAGRRITLPGRYVVARGDNLWRISRRHYARGRHYRTIYRANRSRIDDPDLIYPGQRLRLPRRHH